MKHRSLFILFALALVVAFARPSLAQNDIGIQFDRVDDDSTPEVDDAGFPGLRLILTPMNPSGVPSSQSGTRPRRVETVHQRLLRESKMT